MKKDLRQGPKTGVCVVGACTRCVVASPRNGGDVMNLIFGLMTDDSYPHVVHVGDSYLDDSYCTIRDD